MSIYEARIKNVGYVSLPALALTLVLTGCGENADDSASRTQELVFNDRNVEQVRGQMEAARSASPGSGEQLAKYRTASAARAAGLVRARVQVFDGSQCALETAVGSGTMSSSTRMVTAHHVIDGLDLDADDELRVGFGGSCTGGFNVNCDGLWVQDDSSSVEEENPLLGNRLFQLGLRWWARKPSLPGYTDAKLARDTLRSWPFELDDIDNQPFGRSGSRRDVTILRAAENRDFLFEPSDQDDPYYNA